MFLNHNKLADSVSVGVCVDVQVCSSLVITRKLFKLACESIQHDYKSLDY